MYLGFDTSNYTTSVAVFDGENVVQEKRLLKVKQGERGLRQSDAVFQHTVNMPMLIDNLPNLNVVKAVSVSTRPRNIEGSYMPCFLVGTNNAVSFSKALSVNLYKTSHQVGHILAALYSVNRLDLVNERFICFHVSGGTTEALLVEPDAENIISTSLVAQSIDLKAGQAIDRAGVMLGLSFPCGKELDKLSQYSNKEFVIKPSLNGLDCSLSGVENKAKKMFDDGICKEDISKFVLSYISTTIEKMTDAILEKFGKMPLVYAGGVMSNSLIRKNITERFDAYFASPEFSCDNAAGIAIYGYLKELK